MKSGIATEHAMQELADLLRTGRAKRETVISRLKERHCCRLMTLCRASLLHVDNEWVKTNARYEHDRQQKLKRQEIKLLENEILTLKCKIAKIQESLKE